MDEQQKAFIAAFIPIIIGIWFFYVMAHCDDKEKSIEEKVFLCIGFPIMFPFWAFYYSIYGIWLGIVKVIPMFFKGMVITADKYIPDWKRNAATVEELKKQLDELMEKERKKKETIQ